MKRTLSRVFVVAMLTVIATISYSQSFTEMTGIVLPGASSGSASWGDYDNDGDLDLLLSGIDQSGQLLFKIFTNNGASFNELAGGISPDPGVQEVPYGYNYTSQWSDFNNDKYLDIIIAGTLSTGSLVSIYRNNAGTSFTQVYTSPYLTFQGGTSFDCGDYDNDGDVDFILTNSVETKMIRNNGAFTFADVPAVRLPGLTYSCVKFFDYDNDSDLDIALNGRENWSAVSFLFRNEGYNSFVKQNTEFGMGSIDAADYNGDGLSDILITGNSRVYKNNGNNTFSIQYSIIIPNISGGEGKWGDFDNDGDNDILITGENITKIFINNGDNTFTGLSQSMTGLTQTFTAPGDYDSDGDIDFVICGIQGSSKYCKLYRNDCAVTNPAPVAPLAPVSTFSGNDVILTWNAVATDNTPAASLSYNLIVGTSSGANDIVVPSSLTTTGYFRKASAGNGQYGTTFVLRNLKKQNYFWRVQAVDNSFRGGAFSAEGSFNYNVSVQAYGLVVTSKGGRESTIGWNREMAQIALYL